MKIQNLKPYRIEESDGTLECYDNNHTITIKKNNYSISNKPNVFYKIECLDKIEYTEYLKTKISDKFVYLLRNSDANNEELYVSLTFWQNIKFILIHWDYKFGYFIKRFCKGIVTICKWFIELLF